jgi:hypothetical protein
MATTYDPAVVEAIDRRLAKLEAEVAEASAHPAAWLRHTKAIDPKTGEEFTFSFSEGWEWQHDELDTYLHQQVVLRLKARQLGVSWLGIGYCTWKCLTQPGTRALCVSINETEAVKLVGRAWDLYENSPEHLRFQTTILKPERGRPSSRIEWEFPDGRISSLLAMPSTPRAGHGETASVVFLDEFGRHQWASESYKAFIPTMADGGQLLIVSTANGYGNLFYELWTEAADRDIAAVFLGADRHPGRDDDWFRQMRKRMPAADMAEQYPLNAAEAFLGTAGCWFDVDSLDNYARKARSATRRGRFIPSEDGASATWSDVSNGWILVYDMPQKECNYAGYMDVATGRGKDATSAFIIDLGSMNIAAELHGKIDPDLAAEQLHFLGRWYNTARLAVEMGGGYGEPVVIALRDGKKGRRPYPKLYRHVQDDRPDWKQNASYGFPVNPKTRPQLVNQIEAAIREELLPHIPMQTILECKTFVRRDTLPSPRAAEGCNDDRVMALAGALEMYRRYGSHPHDVRTSRKRKKREYVHDYAWS